MNISFSPPDITEKEIELVAEAMRSGWITTGPKTKEFENEISRYCGAKKAACLASATAAMELALRILGVGDGDEVITCAYTYTASASVIEHVGARPVLVDTDAGSPFISPEKLKAAITKRTKAVIPVDFAGIPAAYDTLKQAIDAKKELFCPNSPLQEALGRIAIIGDCAHSFGAEYKNKSVALASDFACFSFHAVKNLTTAEGGAVVFGDIGDISADEIYKKFMLYSLHGQSKDALAKTNIGAWEYDIILPGYKCNMTDITASIGLGQLARYPELLRRRKEMVELYDKRLAGTVVKPLAHKGKNYIGSHHLYIVAVDGFNEEKRNSVIADLGDNGISANVHYKPLPMMTAYKAMGYDIKDFPNSFGYYQKEITLPLHTLLTDEQIDYVTTAVRTCIEARR